MAKEKSNLDKAFGFFGINRSEKNPFKGEENAPSKKDLDNLLKSLTTELEEVRALKEELTSIKKSLTEDIDLDTISKSLKEVEDIKKSVSDTSMAVQEGFKNIQEQIPTEENITDIVQKSVSSDLEKISENGEKIGSILERVDTLEKQPVGRKSIVKSFGNRFEGEGDNSTEGMRTLSLTHNKKEILNVLEARSGMNGGQRDETYLKAVLAFDATRTLSKGIIDDLKKDKINIIK